MDGNGEPRWHFRMKECGNSGILVIHGEEIEIRSKQEGNNIMADRFKIRDSQTGELGEWLAASAVIMDSSLPDFSGVYEAL